MWNPSSWTQRIWIAVIAVLAVVICIYMGLYQWRVIQSVWDPIFGEQTAKVLDSNVSHILALWGRVPDAVLGGVVYFSDMLFAIAGSERRWYDRPWLVTIFALDVIPLGIVSAILVCMQGLVVGSWCFLCLVTAAISLTLVCLAWNEPVACMQYLARVWKRSRSWKMVWWTFWGRASDIAREIVREMEAEHVGKNR